MGDLASIKSPALKVLPMSDWSEIDAAEILSNSKTYQEVASSGHHTVQYIALTQQEARLFNFVSMCAAL